MSKRVEREPIVKALRRRLQEGPLIRRYVPEFVDSVADDVIAALDAAPDADAGRVADLDAGREWMRRAWHEFNAIRARDGAPSGVSHEWWSEITDGIGALIGDDTKPWMLGAATQLVKADRDRANELERRIERAREEVAMTAGEMKAHGEIHALAVGRASVGLHRIGTILRGDAE